MAPLSRGFQQTFGELSPGFQASRPRTLSNRACTTPLTAEPRASAPEGEETMLAQSFGPRLLPRQESASAISRRRMASVRKLLFAGSAWVLLSLPHVARADG